MRKAHKRIIWDCCWYRDDQIVTVSRDGICKIWKMSSTADGPGCDCLLEFSPFKGAPVTAVDVSSNAIDRMIIALGCENGRLSVWEGSLSENRDAKIKHLMEASLLWKHGRTIKRLRWSPNATNNKFQLASVGEDHTVRIYSLHLSNNDR